MRPFAEAAPSGCSKPEKWCARRVSAGGETEVNFVGVQLEIACNVPGRDGADCLVVGQDAVDRKEAKTRNHARGTLDAVGVGDCLPQHLVAAAKSQHMPAAPHMGRDVDVPTLLAKKSEIGDCGLGTRNDNQIRVERQRRAR